MRKYLFCLMLVADAVFVVKGQQTPQYTQYIFNNFLVNPALAGIENYTDVKAGYRKQWQGIEGAPVTSYLSVNMPLGRNFLYGNATSFGGQDANPMNRSYKQNYMAAEPHHGIGLQIQSDKAGPFSRTDIAASYAYHLGLTEKINLAAGVSAGFTQVRLDIAGLTFENEYEPALSGTGRSQAFNAGAGIWLYGPVFFAGISAQQLLPQRLSFSDSESYSEGKLQPHFFATAGYKIFLGEDIAAVPSVMAKAVSPVPVVFDFNCKLAFRDMFWLGGGYRDHDSFSAMAGFNIGHLFNLSYSYDFTTSKLKTVSNGTHEIVLGLLLNNRYRATCPQRQM